MRVYKIELMIDGQRTDYYIEKARDVRAVLSRFVQEEGISVLAVLATPEFDEWDVVEVS
jgi:hypothetical protein